MSLKELANLLAQATQQKSVEQEFLYMLNNTIQQANITKTKPTQAYKPSSLGGCKRQTYFMLVGEDIDHHVPSPELVGMAEIGSHRHEDIQKYIAMMSQYGYPAEYVDVASYVAKMKQLKKQQGKDYNVEILEKQGMEQKLFDRDRNIRFMADGIIRFKNKLYVFEYKTESSFKWQSRTQIAENHMVQAGIACMVFELQQAIFIYENRDTCAKKPFMYTLTEEHRNYIQGLLDEIDYCVLNSIVPPKTEITKYCNYCLYREGACKKY